MKPDTSRNNVEQSLGIWAQAEQAQQSILSDDYGDIHLVYASLPKQEPELEISKKRQAVLSVVSKIQNELRDFSAKTGTESVEQLLMRLPSLGRFSASGKLGNLREEWLHLREYQTHRLAELASKRQKIFSEFSQHLPQMPTHFEADGTAILRHEFNTPEHQHLIKTQIEEANKYKLDDKGYYRTFTADLPRNRWLIKTEDKIQKFELGQAEEKLAAIKRIFSDDQSALSTTSKIMNQVAPSFVTVLLNSLFPRDLEVFIRSDKNNSEETFYQISSEGNLINFESNTYTKSETIILNPDKKNQCTWKVNQGEKWKVSPGPKNYAQHYRLSIQLDKLAASQGMLRIAEGTRIEASAEFRLCPSIPEHSGS